MKDMVGKKFSRLTLLYIEKIEKSKSGLKKFWMCECECGNNIVVNQWNLTRKNRSTKSCGCLQKEIVKENTIIHGMYGTPTHFSWQTMKQRCLNTNSPEFFRYGGDGVVICDRWLESFNNFYEDMGERPEGTSLNRKRGSKIYSKETCEWASLSIQSYDQKTSKRNTSGKVGVSWNKSLEKWDTYIKINKKQIRLGYFEDYSEAVKVREKAELELYGFNRGENDLN